MPLATDQSHSDCHRDDLSPHPWIEFDGTRGERPALQRPCRTSRLSWDVSQVADPPNTETINVG